MNFYETISILRQDTSIQGVKNITDELKTILVNMGAKVVKHEYWGLRQLAYSINRNKRGHYVALYIEASPDAIAELERNYKIKENIIRFMILKVKLIDSGPSIMMQSVVGTPEEDLSEKKEVKSEKSTETEEIRL